MTFGHVLGTAQDQASMFDYHSAPRFESDQGKCCGAGDENRTRMTSLEGWGSAIELHPRSVMILSRRGVSDDSRSRGDRTRTCDLLLPKQTR
jgi:hypothetical protein